MFEIVVPFLCGILPGMIVSLIGAGSGIILTPLLLYVLDIPIHTAVPLSILMTLFIASYNIYKNFKQPTIEIFVIIMMGICAIVGANVGANVNLNTTSSTLKFIFSIFVMIAAILTWPRKKKKLTTKSFPKFLKYIIIMISGLVSGALNALLGVSGGIINVPTLTVLAKYNIRHSINASYYMGAITTISGLISYFYLRNDLQNFVFNKYLLIIMLILGSLFGSSIGHKMSKIASEESLHKIFSIFVLLIGISIVCITIIENNL